MAEARVEHSSEKLSSGKLPASEGGVYTWENIYAKIWGLKREEGICSKGAYFQELAVSSFYSIQKWREKANLTMCVTNWKYVFCSSVFIQYNTWMQRNVKNGEGLGTPIM